MNKIQSFDEYKSLTEKAKLLPHRMSNCFFLPATVKSLIEQDRLSFQEIKNGIMLLESESGFYRCYYYLTPDIPSEVLKLDRPGVIEFVFQNSLSEKQREQIEILEKMGFVLGRESARISAPIPEKLPDRESTGEAEVSPALSGDLAECRNLFYSSFDPLYSYLPDDEELAEAIAGKKVLTVRADDKIAGALYYEIEKTVAAVRLLTVRPECQHRGLAQKLVTAYMRTASESAGSFSHWVNKSNDGAIMLYSKFGYAFDGRYANEYILK
ncbi:MAG: GNAT family N-acetyltransferase [Candidatus Limivicinus sp.]